MNICLAVRFKSASWYFFFLDFQTLIEITWRKRPLKMSVQEVVLGRIVHAGQLGKRGTSSRASGRHFGGRQIGSDRQESAAVSRNLGGLRQNWNRRRLSRGQRRRKVDGQIAKSDLKSKLNNFQMSVINR